VGGQCPAPTTLPPGKTWYPLYRRLGGPQGQPGQVQKFSPPLGFDPRTVQLVVSHYTDWAIPAHWEVGNANAINLIAYDCTAAVEDGAVCVTENCRSVNEGCISRPCYPVTKTVGVFRCCGLWCCADYYYYDVTSWKVQNVVLNMTITSGSTTETLIPHMLPGFCASYSSSAF
jgi:hypothetical protein